MLTMYGCMIVLLLLTFISNVDSAEVLHNAENLELLVVPNDIPIDVTIINLRSNLITSVGTDELKYTSLHNVDLKNNSIDVFSSDAFGDCLTPCVNLRKLLLGKNTLDTVPDLTSVGTTLKILDLSYNNISSLTANDLYGLDVLTTFDLAGNPIFWPADMSGLDNVADTLLNLSLSHAAKYGSVSDISFLQNFMLLQELHIEAIDLYDLPAFTGYTVCNTLQVMDVSGNFLHDSFIPNIDCLTNIRVLLFYYNEFEAFPVLSNSIKSTLEVIDIGDQFLTVVPDTLLTGMTSLQQLLLESNDIATFPDFPQEMTSLTHLDLSVNAITYLTKDHFIPLPNLEFLDIRENGVTVIPDIGDIYFSRSSMFNIIAYDNPFVCDCGFNFTLRASSAYETVPNVNVSLSENPCTSPAEYAAVSYTTVKLYDLCPAFSTVTTTAMDTTEPETSTAPDTTTAQLITEIQPTTTGPETMAVTNDITTTTAQVGCEPIPVWLNIATENTDPQLGDVIDYKCQTGLQFDDIIDEEEQDGEPDNIVTKTSRCSETDGSWEQEFVECSELIDAEEQKTYWAPVEAKYAEFIGSVAIIFLIAEVTLIFILDGPTFVKTYKTIKKHRMCWNKPKHTAKVGQVKGQPNHDVTEVELDGTGDASIV